MTDQNDSRTGETIATTAPVTIVSGYPDEVEVQALGSVIGELIAEAKAQQSTQPRRGTWGTPGGDLPAIESFHPRSFQNLQTGN